MTRYTGETTLVAGPGDVTRPVNSADGTVLRWNVGCGNVQAPHMTVLEHLEQTTRDGRMSRDLQFPVVGWRVTNRAARIKRSYVARVRSTATPSVSPALPTGSPIYPVTPPSAMPSEGGGIQPTKTATTDHFSAGWSGQSEPTWVSDGLQPSIQITGAPVLGKTTPLPKRPVLGGATTTSSGASSISGASNTWLTVASSVLALTVVTLPTVDRTMRGTSTDDETPTDEKGTTSQATPKDSEDDSETWSAAGTTESDAEKSSETDRGDFATTTWRDQVASNPMEGPTFGSQDDSTTVVHAGKTTTTTTTTTASTTTTTTTSHQLPVNSLPLTSYQHTSPSMSSQTLTSDTQTISTAAIRSRKRTRRPKFRPWTRRPSRKRTRVPHVDYAPVIHRRLDRIVVNAGDILLHHIANDTFIDYQVCITYKCRRAFINATNMCVLTLYASAR